MKEKGQGIEVENNLGEKVGDIYFYEKHQYIAAGSMPIIIKNISEETIEFIGSFFRNHGINPQESAFRIDIANSNGNISIRIIDKILYFYQEKIVLQWSNVGLSEYKKVGIYFRKQKGRQS